MPTPLLEAGRARRRPGPADVRRAEPSFNLKAKLHEVNLPTCNGARRREQNLPRTSAVVKAMEHARAEPRDARQVAMMVSLLASFLMLGGKLGAYALTGSAAIFSRRRRVRRPPPRHRLRRAEPVVHVPAPGHGPPLRPRQGGLLRRGVRGRDDPRRGALHPLRRRRGVCGGAGGAAARRGSRPHRRARRRQPRARALPRPHRTPDEQPRPRLERAARPHRHVDEPRRPRRRGLGLADGRRLARPRRRPPRRPQHLVDVRQAHPGRRWRG